MQNITISINAVVPATKAQLLHELAAIIKESNFAELGRLNNNWSTDTATIRIRTEQIPA